MAPLATKIEQWLLLDKIIIKYNGTVIKTYQFNQSLQGSNYNSYSALIEVVESGTGSSKFNSTVFSYQNPSNVSFSQTTNNTTHDYITYKSRLVTGDFNGDGKADFLCLPDSIKGATWKGMKIYAGDGSDNFTLLCSSTISLYQQKLRDIRVIDLNGDGKDDIIYEYAMPNPDSSSFCFITCDGQSLSQPVLITKLKSDQHTGISGKIRRNGTFQEEDNEKTHKYPKQPVLAKNNLSPNDMPKTGLILDSDIDGDGKNEVFINDPNGHVQIFRYGSNSMINLIDQTFLYDFKSDILEGDFDGDGRMDFWSFSSAGLSIFNYDLTNAIIPKYNSSWPTDSYYFTMGDFNGDGKTDLFIYGWKDSNGVEYDWPNWQIQLSNGVLFEQHDVPQRKANLKNDYLRIGDFNGDGSSDLMVNSSDQSWQGTYFYISSNFGTNLYTESLLSYPPASHKFYLADFDGDGRTDFLCTDGVSPWWNGYQMYKSGGITSLLMNKMANGVGFLTKIIYTKLSQASTSEYQKESNAIFPVIDYIGPWYIVKSVREDNGSGSKNTQNYYYQGAKIHRQGRGFIEYTKLCVTDVATNILSGTLGGYNTSYYYPTLLKSFILRAGTSDTIQVTKNYWLNFVLGIYTPYTIFPYIQNSVETNKLTGFSNSTSYQYDFYGNPTIVTRSYQNGPTVTTTTIYENTFSPSIWLLGRPFSVSTQYVLNGSPTITRSGTRVFDTSSNNLLSETWYSGTNNQILKSYLYNSNGTLQSETSTANSM